MKPDDDLVASPDHCSPGALRLLGFLVSILKKENINNMQERCYINNTFIKNLYPLMVFISTGSGSNTSGANLIPSTSLNKI